MKSRLAASHLGMLMASRGHRGLESQVALWVSMATDPGPQALVWIEIRKSWTPRSNFLATNPRGQPCLDVGRCRNHIPVFCAQSPSDRACSFPNPGELTQRSREGVCTARRQLGATQLFRSQVQTWDPDLGQPDSVSQGHPKTPTALQRVSLSDNSSL